LGLIIAALMVLVLLVFWRYQSVSSELEVAEAQADRLQADTAAIGARLSQWRAIARRQSDSVEALQAEARRLDRRLDRARQSAAVARRRAARAAAAVTVPDSVKGCLPAVQWAARQADSLATDW
jgi:glycerol-3-phosphate acyltransferase PlsY